MRAILGDFAQMRSCYWSLETKAYKIWVGKVLNLKFPSYHKYPEQWVYYLKSSTKPQPKHAHDLELRP
jgi:hypothetical protein